MSQVSLWLLFFITLSFPTCEVMSQGGKKESKPSRQDSSVFELVKQSGCEPRETLVNVHEEFPKEIQYTLLPRCVPVKRCSGCCTDEATECIPKKTETVNLQVMRVYPNNTEEMIVLQFVSHTECNCRRPRRKSISPN